jgi:plastocyanin|tara:strand:- start:8934 stop:11156 length:2223 start_codon:yes stop_codon:yes gene_type:complete
MSKKLYNLVLQEGTDEAAFISTEAAGMEVHDNLSMFDMLLCMRLTEDEAAILESSEKVLEIGPERTVIETISYPSSTPRYEGPTVSYRTKFNPSSGAGAAHTGLNMFFTSEFNTADGTPPFGYFQGAEYQFDDTVKSNFLGEYVDIVAIEAGAPLAGYAGTEDHVDFEEWDSNNSKFIAMDWSTVNGSASSTRNNQITNGYANTFSAHAIGVLSAAGGKYCGWGKKSTLRVMYLSDGVATAYQTVLAWHNAKSVNAETGLKNATIVTGAWGFSGVEHEQFYKIEDIKTFVTYDKDTGASTTHTRPTGTGSAQTITLVASASGSSDYIVNGTDRSGTISGNDPTINAVVGDTITMNNNANGAHPMFFKTAATTGQGQQVSGASGQGSASMSWTPGSAGTYYYICEYHSSMVGQIIVSESQPSGWGDDYSVFADNLAIPRVILDTNGPTIDKWMVSIPDQTRYSTFDTIMSSYASAGGIYHFKSAGNNAHVGVSPEDPRHNNQITIESGSTYVINNPDSNGFNQFSSGSISTDTNKFVNRNEIDGGPNQFTIAACQQDDVNRLLDDYSNRGPMCDFASYGAFTWTSYPTGTYSDGQWGYFSGTSCAAPVAAGCATVFLEWYVTQRGVWPTMAQLKELMVNSAKENLIGEDLINFSSIPTAADISSTKLYNSSEVNRIKTGDSQNGGADLTELYGTPPLRVHIPWAVRMGTGKYIAGGAEQTTYKRRPTSGSVWPRRKVIFSS